MPWLYQHVLPKIFQALGQIQVVNADLVDGAPAPTWQHVGLLGLFQWRDSPIRAMNLLCFVLKGAGITAKRFIRCKADRVRRRTRNLLRRDFTCAYIAAFNQRVTGAHAATAGSRGFS
jgi:hypothetical protein